MKENSKEMTKPQMQEEVLSDEDLDQVVGGVGMQHVKKEQPVDISPDTLAKISK